MQNKAEFLVGSTEIIQYMQGKVFLSIDSGCEVFVFNVSTLTKDERESLNPTSYKATERKLASYVSSDLDGRMKCYGKASTASLDSVTAIEEYIRSLKLLVKGLKEKQKQESKKYKELLTKGVILHRDIDELDPNSEEAEFFRLHKEYGTKPIFETDQQRINELKLRIGDPLRFTTASKIPPGREYDDHRELLRLQNKLRRKKSRENKIQKPEALAVTSKPQVQEKVATDVILLDADTLEIIKPESQPENRVIDILQSTNGLVLEVLAPLPSVEHRIQAPPFEDYEAGSDPLQVLSWPEYYFVDRFHLETAIEENFNWIDWDVIKDAYRKLQGAHLKGGRLSNREKFVLVEIIQKFGRINRDLPKLQ